MKKNFKAVKSVCMLGFTFGFALFVASCSNSGSSSASSLSTKVTSVSVGWGYTCVRNAAGAVKCLGSNEWGQLGNGFGLYSNVPVGVSGLTSGVAAVSTGLYSSCALTISGGVKCWGANDKGQLGNGYNTDSNVPVDVSGLTSGVAAVSAGVYSSCALTTSGGVKCWGANDKGQLGNGTKVDSNIPVDANF